MIAPNMECVEIESEPEKQNDDSPEKGKLVQQCFLEDDLSSGEESRLNIPLTVTQLLDDSGIGPSLRELKDEAGLSPRLYTTNQTDHKNDVNFHLREATKSDIGYGKESEQAPSQLENSEDLFETPPNSLLANVPVPVLSKVAELADLAKQNSGALESAEKNIIEEDNVSDSTLTSTSQNGRESSAEMFKKEDVFCDDSRHAKQSESSSVHSEGLGKYNPSIPVKDWCPVKSSEAKCDKQQCYNEGSGLPPEQWTPSKAAKQQVPDGGSPAKVVVKNSPLTVCRRSADRKKFSFEEIIEMLGDKIQGLLLKTNFCGTETRSELKFIQKQTRYSSDVILNRRIAERIVKMGIAHVYLKVWQSVSNIDYLASDNLIVFKNLQSVLSIVWNCTDKSAALCETLVKCGVVQLLVEELKSDKLRLGDLSDENTLYLVKAYLGVLHNMARLCVDSRKIFRCANAVEALKLYLSSEIGLVKTKAYLVLSYIINEEENTIINATHDLLNYIIGILREALTSENHFAKTTAFWANEIADGLNHLAVNDANKVRMGQLGAIQLYLKLLQSNSVEEQSLGTAGIWILAFCDENKYLISKVQGCTEALQILANNSPVDSIRRSARGALWVIKKAPERPTVQQVKDTDVPHVMISYQWSVQNVMVRVRNRLKSAGYKVWLDVDNMSGSTLEAMALAVERAAVVVICMSQLYKDSASCRTEAEYTYSQRKEIIPLLLQPGYVPDGWLGALVGTRVYFDFTDEEIIHTQVDKLIRELGSRGRLSSPKRTLGVAAERQHTRGDSEGSELSLSSSTSSLHSYMRLPTALSWSPAEVQQWLCSHQLSHVADRFEGFTGELLLQYKTVMKTAPEYFYSSLETKLKLDLLSSLKFSKALGTLAGTT